MSDLTETPLQMAARHVREGHTRIAGQEALIADLERKGLDLALPEANRFLETMRRLQAEAEEHLAQRLAESAGKGQS